MGNNLIKEALAEAGYLDTPRRRNLSQSYQKPRNLAAPRATRIGFILEGQR